MTERLPEIGSNEGMERYGFVYPITVNPGISISNECWRLGIIYSLPEGAVISDWTGDPECFSTPKNVYRVWVQDGTRNLNKSAWWVRNNLHLKNERCATIYEGLAFVDSFGLQIRHNIDLPGTDLGRQSCSFACLGWYAVKANMAFGKQCSTDFWFCDLFEEIVSSFRLFAIMGLYG